MELHHNTTRLTTYFTEDPKEKSALDLRCSEKARKWDCSLSMCKGGRIVYELGFKEDSDC